LADLPLQRLTEAFKALEATQSGNEMVAIVARLLSETPAAVIDKVCYFLAGGVAAEYHHVVLGIGERLLAQALARASGKSLEEIDRLHNELGDFGLVAERVLAAQKKLKVDLTVGGIHRRLLALTDTSGKGSQEAKLDLLIQLFGDARPQEARYLARLILGVLRLGAGTMTILNALAVAFSGEKRNKAILEEAYNLCSDIGLIAQRLAAGGLDAVRQIDIQVGHPIRMMAAQRVERLAEILERMPEGLGAEEKYDGERVQCHKEGQRITIFSRSLDDITEQYPDVVERVRDALRAKRAIVEGEVVAVDPNDPQHLVEFQRLMSRKRKYEIERYVAEIPTRLFLFDLLYADGEVFMRRPYPERRQRLQDMVQANQSISLARAIFTNNLDEIEDFFDKALEHGCEGIIAKSCADDSIYRAGARAWSWIKWKKDYSAELADTFDLVIVGGFAGRGKRSGLWGAFLCAAYNDELDRYETFCRVSTGFSDEELQNFFDRLKTDTRDERPARIYSELTPTRWFEPHIVIEVQGAEITRSPMHTCGMATLGEGIALRFPRFNRLRQDKSPEEATRVGEILSLYRKR
jgi:DNA ligase-1